MQNPNIKTETIPDFPLIFWTFPRILSFGPLLANKE